MPLVPLTLPSGSTKAKFNQGGSARIINGYISPIGEEGKVQRAVYASDGLQGFCLLQGVASNLGCRAAINLDDVALYVVAGTGLYKVTPSGAQTLIGSMNISLTAPVFMARNRRAVPDIGIVCDGLMFYCRGDVLTQVTDPDLLAPTSLDFSDGYFGITTAQNAWQVGAIDDASAWDGLDFATADADPDSLICIKALQAQFYLFGQATIEVHQDTGNADFPYARSFVIPIGFYAANSIAKVAETMAFIAHDRTVRMLTGGDEPAIISAPDVERDIQSVSDPATIYGTSWVSNGHTFYKLSCPDWTWVYDTRTQKWHERQTYGRKNWRISFVVQFGTRLIAGDTATGSLFEMGPQFLDDAGDPLVTTVTFPTMTAFPYRTTHNALVIDVQRGVGTGQGDDQDVDPELMVEWSHDGGETFHAQRMLKLGQMGRNLTRVRTHRLGQAPENGRVYRLSWSAKVDRALYAAAVDLERNAA
jgi:hypothetical protein